MRQDFVFADQRCGGDLRHHEPGIQAGPRSQKWRQTLTQGWVYQSLQPALGDAGQHAEGNAEEIQSEGQRLAVKIAAGYDVCFQAGGTALRWADDGVRPEVSWDGFQEYQRIVYGRVDFNFHDFATVSERVANRAVDLRHAAQRVRVLHAVAVDMRLA